MTSPFQNKVIDYEQSIFTAGLHYARPPFTFQSTEWESEARKILSASSWGYVHGNAGAGSTYRNNLAAFSRWSIVPRRLVPSRRRNVNSTSTPAPSRITSSSGGGVKENEDEEELFADTSVTVLGQKLPFPIATAPVGVQKIFNPEGEAATARASASLGIPYILSTASSTSIEDAAAANGEGSPRWYQLYWPSRSHDDITISLLRRAQRAGYTTLFVTLDTYVLGWRASDLDNGYNPFIHPDRIGVEIGMTDPVFRNHFQEKHGYGIDECEAHDHVKAGKDLGPAAREWAKIVFPGHSHSWEDIPFLQRHWDGPIVLKGIQSVADAKKCVAAGVQGIVVSNHGGRQQDGGPSSLGMLPKIVDAVGDKLDIFFDSGVRCGADVMKALALGAKCVLLGRPYIYGLAMGGEEGVRHVLRATCGDLMLNMHLAGLRSVDEITRDVLVPENEQF